MSRKTYLKAKALRAKAKRQGYKVGRIKTGYVKGKKVHYFWKG